MVAVEPSGVRRYVHATRYSALKRCGFACRLCGQSAPDVVLEVGTDPEVDDGKDFAICSACRTGRSQYRKLLARPDTFSAQIIRLLNENPQMETGDLARAIGANFNTAYVLRKRLERIGQVPAVEAQAEVLAASTEIVRTHTDNELIDAAAHLLNDKPAGTQAKMRELLQQYAAGKTKEQQGKFTALVVKRAAELVEQQA